MDQGGREELQLFKGGYERRVIESLKAHQALKVHQALKAHQTLKNLKAHIRFHFV